MTVKNLREFIFESYYKLSGLFGAHDEKKI